MTPTRPPAMRTPASAPPEIISVDDHVLEPPDLWVSRLPAKYRDVGPRVVRERVDAISTTGGVPKWTTKSDGIWADVWRYEELHLPLNITYAAVGFDELGWDVTTFDQLHPGAWRQRERLEAMERNHVSAALCFPNTLPRFCGQTFYESKDKDLALACVQAYNDWIIDEWSAGDGAGRLIPVGIVPLWDRRLAAAEIERCASKGCYAISFPENPFPLGLPSVHDPGRHWDPVFAACQEASTVVCMHIGSSSNMPTTSPDAPYIVSSALSFQNAMGSLCDYIFSGTLERFPALKVAYSEGQVGWMPYLLERADTLWQERVDNSFGSSLKHAPSSYIEGRVFACIFDDHTGLRNRDAVGMGQICFETDFPHADSNYPHSQETLLALCESGGLTPEESYKLARGNAIAAFGLHRVGIYE